MNLAWNWHRRSDAANCPSTKPWTRCFRGGNTAPDTMGPIGPLSLPQTRNTSDGRAHVEPLSRLLGVGNAAHVPRPLPALLTWNPVFASIKLADMVPVIPLRVFAAPGTEADHEVRHKREWRQVQLSEAVEVFRKKAGLDSSKLKNECWPGSAGIREDA